MKKMNWKTCLAQTASIALTLSLLAGNDCTGRWPPVV